MLSSYTTNASSGSVCVMPTFASSSIYKSSTPTPQISHCFEISAFSSSSALYAAMSWRYSCIPSSSCCIFTGIPKKYPLNMSVMYFAKFATSLLSGLCSAFFSFSSISYLPSYILRIRSYLGRSFVLWILITSCNRSGVIIVSPGIIILPLYILAVCIYK